MLVSELTHPDTLRFPTKRRAHVEELRGCILGKIAIRKLGIIIPTLQERPGFLAEALRSALMSNPAQLIIISPRPPVNDQIAELARDSTWIVSSADLPNSINYAVSSFSKEITHFTWIGDDDLVIPEALSAIFCAQDLGFLVIGWCKYIDDSGTQIRRQKPRSWRLSRTMLTLISSPIAQPASLISIVAFNSVDGIDCSYDFAFDQDLFTRLVRKYGKPSVIKREIACYRVHGQTLSSLNWRSQLRESAEIRRINSPRATRWLTVATDKIRLMANVVLYLHRSQDMSLRD
jgi:hypothetical protein